MPIRPDTVVFWLEAAMTEFLLIVGNLKVPLPVRMQCWRMANRLQVQLRRR
jgi:hypothetical protein